MNNSKQPFKLNYSKNYNGYRANIIQKSNNFAHINNNYNSKKQNLYNENTNNYKLLKMRLKNNRPSSVAKTKNILYMDNDGFNNENEYYQKQITYHILNLYFFNLNKRYLFFNVSN